METTWNVVATMYRRCLCNRPHSGGMAEIIQEMSLSRCKCDELLDLAHSPKDQGSRNQQFVKQSHLPKPFSSEP